MYKKINYYFRRNEWENLLNIDETVKCILYSKNIPMRLRDFYKILIMNFYWGFFFMYNTDDEKQHLVWKHLLMSMWLPFKPLKSTYIIIYEWWFTQRSTLPTSEDIFWIVDKVDLFSKTVPNAAMALKLRKPCSLVIWKELDKN